MLKKQIRLRKRKEFNYIFKNGRSFATKTLVLTYLPTKLKNPKIGFSVSKKIGNAVIRNKVKRRLREAFKVYLPKINKKYNYIIVARKDIVNLSYAEIVKTLNYALKKTNLMSELNDK
jgi:ribonuclease P protein component